MPKYHISDDGTPGRCTAESQDSCPKTKSGDTFHTEDYTAAIEESERRFENEHSEVATHSKGSNLKAKHNQRQIQNRNIEELNKSIDHNLNESSNNKESGSYKFWNNMKKMTSGHTSQLSKDEMTHTLENIAKSTVGTYAEKVEAISLLTKDVKLSDAAVSYKDEYSQVELNSRVSSITSNHKNLMNDLVDRETELREAVNNATSDTQRELALETYDKFEEETSYTSELNKIKKKALDLGIKDAVNWE